MKSNLRNEIKSYIVRQGMTMQEVVDLLLTAQFNGQRHDELTGKSAVLGRLDFLHGVPELFPILPFLRGIFRQKHFLPDKSLLFCVVMLYPIVIIIQAGTA